ncbi:uncharacterized protein METZ01_LOCUS177357, partial [marine metagenome]
PSLHGAPRRGAHPVPVGGRHGAVRLVGQRPALIRRCLAPPEAPGALVPARSGRHVDDDPDRLPAIAPPRHAGPLRLHRPVGTRPHPGPGAANERIGPLAGPRGGFAAAIRVPQVGVGPLLRRPVVTEQSSAHREEAHAVSHRRPGWRHRWAPDAGAGPGYLDDRGCHRRGDALLRRPAPAATGHARRVRCPRCVRPDDERRLSTTAAVGHARPLDGSTQHRLADHPVRCGHLQRRPVRDRAGRKPCQVGIPAVRTHRLHLRDHRRGVRIRRGRARDRGLPGHRPGRTVHGAARPGPLRPTPGGGDHHLDHDPGVRKHRRRAREASDHRCPVAVRLVRRLGLDRHDGRIRHPAKHRPSDAV